MSALSKLAAPSDVQAETDNLGGGGPLETGLYDFTVKLAYLRKAASGAMGVVLHLETAQGREVRQTLWVMSGDAKGNKTYYEKDGQKYPLPGFAHANSLALLSIGKELSELDTEEKVVKLYDPSAGAEVPQKVDVLVDLLNQPITGAIFKQTVDKNVKNDAGEYVPGGDTRDENEIDKFFRTRDKLTTAEILAEATEPSFYAAWDKKWTGQTRNRAKGAAGGNNGTAGAPAAAQGTQKPKTSLFG